MAYVECRGDKYHVCDMYGNTLFAYFGIVAAKAKAEDIIAMEEKANADISAIIARLGRLHKAREDNDDEEAERILAEIKKDQR